MILATISTKLPRPVIPPACRRQEQSGAVFVFLVRSCERAAPRSRGIALRLIALATSVHRWLLAITPTLHSVRRPSTRSSRSCASKQFRHRHPVFCSGFNAGIGPCGNSAHQQSPSGLQLMAASQRAHRVSITLFSLVAPILSRPAALQNFQLISSPG